MVYRVKEGAHHSEQKKNMCQLLPPPPPPHLSLKYMHTPPPTIFHSNTCMLCVCLLCPNMTYVVDWALKISQPHTPLHHNKVVYPHLGMILSHSNPQPQAPCHHSNHLPTARDDYHSNPTPHVTTTESFTPN